MRTQDQSTGMNDELPDVPFFSRVVPVRRAVEGAVLGASLGIMIGVGIGVAASGLGQKISAMNIAIACMLGIGSLGGIVGAAVRLIFSAARQCRSPKPRSV